MKRIILITLIITSGFVLTNCGNQEKATGQGDSKTQDQGNNYLVMAQENFESLDLSSRPASNSPVVLLGKTLFFDTQLSQTGEVSCNSCHDMNAFGVDNKPLSSGIKGHLSNRNSPTVFNSANQVAQFWDGRAATLREQVKMPIMDQSEMGMTEEEVILRLKADEKYQTQFAAAYPGEDISLDFMADALASFIESQVYHSKFDKFLLGETTLTDFELKGMQVFIEKGCTDCHDGALLGGDDFEKFGIFKNYWVLTKSAEKDSGRYMITRDQEDLFVFKIPTLRNVGMTQPYFHDGSVQDLKEAVKVMGQTQLDIELTNQEADAIVSFLATLTGNNPTI